MNQAAVQVTVAPVANGNFSAGNSSGKILSETERILSDTLAAQAEYVAHLEDELDRVVLKNAGLESDKAGLQQKVADLSATVAKLQGVRQDPEPVLF